MLKRFFTPRCTGGTGCDMTGCCSKRKSSSVSDMESGAAAKRPAMAGAAMPAPVSALQLRLWRCLDSRETASFVLLLRDCSDPDAPRPHAASAPNADNCPGADGCGEKETLLIRACCLNATEEVRALLEHGADPNVVCNDGSGPLQHCARRCSVGCLRLLLQDPRTDVNARCKDGYDALHICAYDPSWKIRDKQARLECIKLLLKHPKFTANKVNVVGQTPLSCALLRYYEERVKVMLECGKSKIDIDWRMFSGRSMRAVIQEKFPALIPTLPSRRIENPACKDSAIRLLAHLQLKDVDTFKTLLEKDCPDLNHFYGDPYYCTIIELACRIPGYEDFVQLLLEAGADPNTLNKIDKNPLIHQAAECANHKALALLLATGLVDISVLNSYNETVLHVATQYISPTEEQLCAMESTVNMLLDYKHFQDYFSDGAPQAINIDAKDEGGDTALHNAAYFGLNHVVLILLRRGANMMLRNTDGDPPLAYMSEETLRTYFDEQIDSNGRSPQSESFELIFRYDCLVPPASEMEEDKVSEMDPMNYIQESEDLRLLIRHPLVRTFLYLKWHTVKTYFMYNLLCYLIFVISLTAYSVLMIEIMDIPDNRTCTTIEEEINPSDNKPINITLQNNTDEGSRLLNTTQFFSEIYEECDLTEREIVLYISLLCMGLLMFLFLLFLIVREFSQLIILKHKYFLSAENIMEITLIAGTIIILFSPLIDESSHRHICGLVILLAWTELILMSGRLPLLSIQLEMFKKVCITFGKFMAWYSLIILAFAFSFFVIFSGDKPFYSNVGMSIVKTVIMLAGEFEASNLKFDNAPGTSHIVFIGFVLLIAIVLLNLLNGLAVYDTQAIKEDATVLSLVSMVRIVVYIEEFLKLLIKISNRIGWCNMGKRLNRKLELFDHRLPRRQIHIFPSARNVKFLLDAETTKKFEKYELSETVIYSAVDIVINRNQETELQKIQGAVFEFSAKLNSMEEILNNIHSSLNKQ